MFSTVPGTRTRGRAAPHDGTAARWLPLAAFLLAVLGTALPILATQHLPLVDLPNHIARLHVAAAPQDGPLGPYYAYSPAFVPNSAADLIWRVLPVQVDPVRFAQLLMAVYAANLIAAAMVLSRVLHGRWSAWPAAAALLVYSGPFFWGFQNFVWSLPFCLYGLALWLAMEGDRWRNWRTAVFVPFAAALYLMHFFAFAILAIAVFGREAQRVLGTDGPLIRRGLGLCVRMIPFVVPVVWLAVTLVTGPEAPGPTKTEFGGMLVRLAALVSPLVAPNTLGFPLLNTLAVLGWVCSRSASRASSAPRARGSCCTRGRRGPRSRWRSPRCWPRPG